VFCFSHYAASNFLWFLVNYDLTNYVGWLYASMYRGRSRGRSNSTGVQRTLNPPLMYTVYIYYKKTVEWERDWIATYLFALSKSSLVCSSSLIYLFISSLMILTCEFSSCNVVTWIYDSRCVVSNFSWRRKTKRAMHYTFFIRTT